MAKTIIGTRGSRLALWQAHWVRHELVFLRPGLELEVEAVRTEGDQRHDLAPAAFGREGIFTAELDRALLEGRIDLAVHSLKDLPTKPAPGLCLAAITERGPVRDVFILRSDHARALDLDENPQPIELLLRLNKEFIVGTSSLRRIAQLKHLLPGLAFQALRGNLDTRIRKLGAKEMDAIVVAEAGMVRLGVDLNGHLPILLSPEQVLPAAGQGALAIMTRENDPARELSALLDHAPTRAAATAERTALAALAAGCRVPAGFLAELAGARLKLRGVVGHPDRGLLVRAEVEGPADDPVGVGTDLSDRLRALGADRILAEVKG